LIRSAPVPVPVPEPEEQEEQGQRSKFVRPAPSAGSTQAKIISLNGPFQLALSQVTSFPGIVSPPPPIAQPWATDASGAVGPNHYVQSVNFQAAIYDKNGNILSGPFPSSAFWNGFSVATCSGGWTDEVVLYDKAAQRWVISRFGAANSNPPPFWYQCFAISQTPDPTGPYYRYAFLIDVNEFNDYPKIGVWPDGYYMTADRNRIFPGLGNFLVAFDRNKMLSGQPAAFVSFKFDDNGHRAGMLPADWDGHTAPPSGSPGYFIRTLDTNEGWPTATLEVWKLAVDWVNSAFNLSLMNSLTPDPFNSALCGDNQNCIPQPGTAQGLDSLSGGRPMFRLAYRNFGNHETLTFNQTVDAGNPSNHAGIRWYELRRNGGAWSIFQQGTFAPDSDHRWIGSLAMDQAGNMAMGYNVSGSVYPSIRIGGRLVSDPAGSMTEGPTVIAGTGAQTGFPQWGDYSQMTLDPLDDCTFWHVGSYQPITSNQQSWATRIAAYRYPSCTTNLTISQLVSPSGPISVGTNVTFSIGASNLGPNYAGNVTMTDVLPAGLGFVSIQAPASWNCVTPPVGASGQITCSETSMAVNEIAAFSLVAKPNCNIADGTQIGNFANVSAATPPDNTPADNMQTAPITVANPTPIFNKSFAPATVAVNLASTLTFTLVNPSSLAAATGVSFTDTLPAGLSAGNVISTVGCGGATFGAAGNTISLSNATIAVSGTCTAQIAVTGNAPGQYMNMTSSLTAGPCTGGTASASLTVVVPPTISKAFGDVQIEVLGPNSTSLSFTVGNPAVNPIPLAGIAFSDTLPAGLIVSTPNNSIGACGGGAIMAVAGSNSISLSGATLSPGVSCVFSVDVTAVDYGVQTNATSPVTSTTGGTIGLNASASISVVYLFFTWFFL
jgi:uncharacterized repeat protein (TIGR01451 family)